MVVLYKCEKQKKNWQSFWFIISKKIKHAYDIFGDNPLRLSLNT